MPKSNIVTRHKQASTQNPVKKPHEYFKHLPKKQDQWAAIVRLLKYLLLSFNLK